MKEIFKENCDQKFAMIMTIILLAFIYVKWRSILQLGCIKRGVVGQKFFPVCLIIVKLNAGQQEVTGIVTRLIEYEMIEHERRVYNKGYLPFTTGPLVQL